MLLSITYLKVWDLYLYDCENKNWCKCFWWLREGGGYQIGFEIEVLKSKIAVHGSVGKKALFWLYINFEFAFISLLYIGIGDRLGG